MNKNYINTLKNYAEQFRLSFDEDTYCIFGKFNGYLVLLVPANNIYNLQLSVTQQGQMPDSKLLKEVVKESKTIKNCIVNGYQVNYSLKNGVKAKNIADNLQEAMTVITDFLKFNGFENCCQSSGIQDDAEIGIYKAEGVPMILAADCFKKNYEERIDVDIKNQKKENFIAGIVGAFLGSLVGVLSIVLLGQLGYVATISGIIMAVCSLKGYELLGGKLSNRGIIVSAVLMIIMVYFGNKLDWAISIAKSANIGVINALKIMPFLISEKYLDSVSYYTNLVMIYIFAGIGAIPTITNALHDRNIKRESCKMYY